MSRGSGSGPCTTTPTGSTTRSSGSGIDYQQISWDQAIAEIGARVRALVDAHGPRAVALYQGNPTFFSFQHVLMSSAYVEALGSPNVFASHSVDTNNKFHVSTAMYGLSLVHPVPDLDRVRFLMCLGSNPTVSQMSVLTVADATAALRGVVDRGGRVVVVDPRRTETVRKVGEHLPIRPGTDAYLLAAMLHVLTTELGADLDRARVVATGVDEVVAVVAPWTPERAAAVTGVPAATIRELAGAYATSDGAAIYMSTGVNMGTVRVGRLLAAADAEPDQRQPRSRRWAARARRGRSTSCA